MDGFVGTPVLLSYCSDNRRGDGSESAGDSARESSYESCGVFSRYGSSDLMPSDGDPGAMFVLAFLSFPCDPPHTCQLVKCLGLGAF